MIRVLSRTLALLTLFASALAARGQSFYGPRTYTLSQAGPQHYVEHFAISTGAFCGGSAAFRLVVESQGVSSAAILLNGVPIVSEKDFSVRRSPFEVLVFPLANNDLAVDLTGGQAGGTLTISVRRDIEQSIVPDETYTLASGRETFRRTVAAAPGSDYVLVVRNGQADGKYRVATGIVTIGDRVVIDQNDLRGDVGNVSKSVVLAAMNNVVVDLRGNSGGMVTVSIRRRSASDSCGPEIVFTEPAPNAQITTSALSVRGTVSGAGDVGVTVNGFPALLDLSHAGTREDPFVWSSEPVVAPGTVVLVAKAVTSGGATAQAQRTVTFLPDPNSVEMAAAPRSGVAPLTVTFHLASPASGRSDRYEIDFNGDGVNEIDAAQLPDPLQYTYSSAGEYQVRIRCTSNGTTTSTTTRILVHSWASQDALLRASWNRFADALQRQNVAEALLQLSPSARQKYEPALRSTLTALPAYTATITGFNGVSIYENSAHYLLRRAIGGHTYGYHVYFTRDSDGVWRINQF